MNGIIAENGKVVTDEMINAIEASLDRDEWPDGWKNVGDVIEGHLPSMAASSTLSVKVPAPMKMVLDAEAERAGISTSAYVRGVLAERLMGAA